MVLFSSSLSLLIFCLGMVFIIDTAWWYICIITYLFISHFCSISLGFIDFAAVLFNIYTSRMVTSSQQIDPLTILNFCLCLWQSLCSEVYFIWYSYSQPAVFWFTRLMEFFPFLYLLSSNLYCYIWNELPFR